MENIHLVRSKLRNALDRNRKGAQNFEEIKELTKQMQAFIDGLKKKK